MKTYVLYHSKCNDGAWAAWVIWTVLKENAEYIPVNYNQAAPEMEEKSLVYIVDFSYSLKEMLELEQKYTVVLIDHHIDSIQELSVDSLNLFSKTLDSSRSGAYLTWNHFYPETDIPEVIKYVDDRDRWQFKLKYSRQIHRATSHLILGANKLDFEAMDKYAKEFNVTELKNRVQKDYKKDMEYIREKCSTAKVFNVQGYDVPVVVADKDGVFRSDIGNMLCHMYLEYPFSLIIYELEVEEGLEYIASFRSTGMAVNSLAKAWGGGGHKLAAGSALPRDQFELVAFLETTMNPLLHINPAYSDLKN